MVEKKSRATQADVARLAGVSQATVSYVLNKSAVSVPEETRQRIHMAMEELGYVPNSSARSLRTRKTHTIAAVIPDIANPFFPVFTRSIQDVADQYGYDLIVYNTDHLEGRERKFLDSLRQGRVDGAIVVPYHVHAKDLAPLLHMDLSVVVLGKMPTHVDDMPLDSLYVNNADAAAAAVTHLVQRGHTRVGMLAALPDNQPGYGRLKGYRRALSAAGLPFDEAIVRHGLFTQEDGYQCMRELLQAQPRPSAVFAANDLMAMGALKAIREAGLTVPQDIALVGFDNIPAGDLISPRLTTITQFQDRLGRRAAEMLFERLNGTAPEIGRTQTMPFELIVREST